MKKIIILFFAILLYADDIQYYLLTVKVNYKEYADSGKFLDSESSSYSDMKGIGVRYDADEKIKYFLKGEYVYGSTVYSGSTWDGTFLSEKTNNVYIYNLQLGVYPFKNPYYISLGYRFWNRGKGDYSGDYNEKYYWHYASFGYAYKFIYAKNSICVDFEYQYAFDPKLNADLGEGVKVDLGVTDGIKFRIQDSYKYSENVILSISYKYQLWHINRSDTVNVNIDGVSIPIYEPESYTRNQYLGIGFIYKY